MLNFFNLFSKSEVISPVGPPVSPSVGSAGESAVAEAPVAAAAAEVRAAEARAVAVARAVGVGAPVAAAAAAREPAVPVSEARVQLARGGEGKAHQGAQAHQHTLKGRCRMGHSSEDTGSNGNQLQSSAVDLYKTKSTACKVQLKFKLSTLPTIIVSFV